MAYHRRFMWLWLTLVLSTACQAFVTTPQNNLALLLAAGGLSDDSSSSSFGQRRYRLASSAQDHNEDEDDKSIISAESIYFEMELAKEPIGRLVFALTNPSPLPLHTENLIQLCRGSRRSIDPLAHYVGCEFDFSPLYVEDGSGRYRWAHTCKGRGRNAIGRSDQAIVDAENLQQCAHSCFGGQYYGDFYDSEYSDYGVVLTVPVVGPGRGTSRFSILRVGESPPEWQERLLLNSGVVGKLVNLESMETLYRMARQRSGPPKIAACGVLV